MIELPEALNLAKELSLTVSGKRVCRVYPPTKPHKFCWFSGNPDEYNDKLTGSEIITAEGFGIFTEILFNNGERICINDGVNVRLLSDNDIPRDYQLLIMFTDKTALMFTVAMYGGIILHSGDYDNEYYLKSLSYISPFSDDFKDYFMKTYKESKQTLSAKAFLATNQRFPGIGNGVLQDILFEAKINPRRKISTLSSDELTNFLSTVVAVIKEMTEQGGRDTEKDIFGKAGGYKTKMSKKTISEGCPVCRGAITKEVYLGGSVYYCKECQPL